MSRLPPSASVAHAAQDGKLFAPSALRNTAVLLELMHSHAPTLGHVLEIASGTGQHITAFAAALPHLHWHPSEPDPTRRASIDAYVADAGLQNVAAAIALDVAKAGWGSQIQPKDLITCNNLTHLITQTATQTMIAEVAQALAPAGRFMLYGPFMRSGMLTSEGDARFDAELRAADPAIGYKDDLDILRMFADAGLSPVQTVQMPANNLCMIAERSAAP